MRKTADRFHGNMELKPEESFKAFLFAVKAFAATGFLFVFGHVAATGSISTTSLVIIALASALDLAPQVVTFRILDVIPEKARKAENLQLFLKLVAYAALVSILAGFSGSVFWGYTAFVVLWLASFVVEESVMFLLKDADDR